MLNIENSAIVEKIKGTGRTFKASIKVGDTTFTEIKSLKQTTPFASNQKISIGETPSSFIEAEIHDCRLSLKGYEIEANLYIDDYLIPLGLFTVQEPTEANGSGIQKIIAYDRMSNTSNFTYEAKGHTNAGDTFAEICSQCGYSAEIDDLTAISVSDNILNGYDCRTALGYLAGFLGKNCVVGSDGIFKMVKYHIVDNEIDINSLDTLDFPSSGSSVDYIFCTVDENKTIDNGTGKSGINIVNPLISTTEQLQAILADIRTGIGTNYYPATFKQLNGDPRIEVGDTILVQHRNILTGDVEADYVPVMSLVKEFDGGLTVTIEAYEPETEFHISTTDQIKLLQAANKNTSKRTEVVAELNEVVANALGLYKTEISGAGGDVKIYYHNASTLDNSTYIFTMNAEGFAFTTGKNCWNDGKPIWMNGITKDGNAIFNYLFAEKISANLIEAGKLTSVDGKTYFDLNAGQFGTTVTETGESGEEVVKYSYKQDADGVSLETGLAITFEEFESNMTDEEKAEITKIEEQYPGTNAIIVALRNAAIALKKYLMWRNRIKGYEISSLDIENVIHHCFNFSSNKAFFTKLSGSERVTTEFSVDGIKSNKRLKIDAPGIELPWVVLPSGTDFNTVLTPGDYSGDVVLGDGTNSNYLNSPTAIAADFSLEVIPTGRSDQRLQRLTLSSKGYSRKWERHYHSGSWGAWYCTYSDRNTILWSGVNYMNADQTITLSEPISRQPSGIILSFSPYENNTAGNHNFNRFYISKYDVLTHGGSSGTFTMFRNLFSTIATKTLYISDQTIKGHANNVASGTQNGITYNGKNWVLREVVGV